MTTDATGIIDTVRTIAADEGPGALYAGIAPKVVRALASGAIQVIPTLTLTHPGDSDRFPILYSDPDPSH